MAIMNLNQLRAFYSVIKTGTFSKAADELCVTEPAVFIQVRSFERYLGFTLLDRFGKELRPTEIGRVLYEYAEKIFTLVDEATNAVKDLQDLKKGYLRLGVTQSLAQYLMPLLVPTFQDRYPHIAVYMDGSSSRGLVEGILEHRYELAVVARVPYPDRINFIPYTRDEILLVVSPHHGLAKREKVSLEELAKEPVILTDAKSAVKFSIWEGFEKRGLQPAAIIEAGNIEFIKQLVEKGKGYSFLASVCVREEIRRGVLTTIPLEQGDFAMDIDIIHLKGKTLSPAASTFLHFMQENRESTSLGKLTDKITKRASTV
jgi:DNA-binding transcriptional LysR family regulator